MQSDMGRKRKGNGRACGAKAPSASGWGRNRSCLLFPFWVLLLTGCLEPTPKVAEGVFRSDDSGPEAAEETWDLSDIQANGELIVLTMYGPATYFEFRGEDFGFQYRLADAFAQSIGVTVRVSVCRSTTELVERLREGEGDLIACNMEPTDSLRGELTYCGEREISQFMDTLQSVDPSIGNGKGKTFAWAVSRQATNLSAQLDSWLTDHQRNLLAIASPHVADSRGRVYAPRRRALSPMLDAAHGRISIYDALFKKYASSCGWDWRLLAAQSYQESAFDSHAVSWMGAMGLMQLMPSTARDMGVGQHEIFVPEPNIRGAARLIRQLDSHYADIRNADERINFVLAAYNAGAGHVDDARRMARKHGCKADVWTGEVERIVLRMSDSRFYNDPLVQHGYFRGSETFNYVRDIRSRWADYRRRI